MAGLTLLAIVLWWTIWDHSQTTESLKWLQCIQTVGTFLLPPVICAALWDADHQPHRWLHLNRTAHWSLFLLAVGIMIAAIPGINLLADLNSRVVLPSCLASLEQFFKEQEATAAALTERFLQADTFGQLLINIGLMALLPAFAEEFTFRGTLQQIISNSEQSERSNSETVYQRSGPTAQRSAVAIWITAIVFSAVHMQFYGFVPRMLLGAMFGYVFVWAGSLWIPILMHFVNNGLAVLAFYLTSNSGSDPTFNIQKNWADTIGAGSTWWVGVISILITSLGLLIFYRRTHTQ